MRDNHGIALCDMCQFRPQKAIARSVHVRAYRNMEAVAAVGSKYLIMGLGEEKSLGSAAIFPFLDDLPEELMEALRCRGTDWWAEDDIVALISWRCVVSREHGNLVTN